jgi:DNA-binding MarR family transcriptional regulator
MSRGNSGVSAIMDERVAVKSGDQEREVLIALGRIVRSANSGVREAGRAAGLGASHLLVLQLLDAEGPCKAGEIAKELAFSKSTITAILDSLGDRDLIARERDENDGRSVIVSLTEAGRNALGAVPASFQAQFLRRFSSLPDWERALVAAALLRVCDWFASTPSLV